MPLNKETKVICFQIIQNCAKSNRELYAWTEVWHQIFGGWQVQTMWNVLKNMWFVQRSMFYSKNLYKWVDISFPQLAWTKKSVIERKCIDASVKKIFQPQQFAKKVTLIDLCDIKWSVIIDYLEEVEIVYNASQCQLFSQNSTCLLNDPTVCVYASIYIYQKF